LGAGVEELSLGIDKHFGVSQDLSVGTTSHDRAFYGKVPVRARLLGCMRLSEIPYLPQVAYNHVFFTMAKSNLKRTGTQGRGACAEMTVPPSYIMLNESKMNHLKGELGGTKSRNQMSLPPITYYLDSSVYNQLAHQPGRPDAVERLKQARDGGKACTYMSRYLLHELVVTYKLRPNNGIKLIKAVQDIAVPGRVMKDTPFFFEQDIKHLVDPSVNTDFLEPSDSKASINCKKLVAKLASGEPLHDAAMGWIEKQSGEQQRLKDQWRATWSALAEVGKSFNRKAMPKTVEDFFRHTLATNDMRKNVSI
jgi:hypothetical protein